jgi:iron complex outermembrane receptor protein
VWFCRVRWWAAVLLTAASAPVYAQPADEAAGSGSGSAAKPEPPATTGEVSGTVESPELEAPLAGATVKVVGTSISTTTDDAGHFKLDLPPGGAKIRAESAGFRAEERTIKVETDSIVEIAFKLNTIPQINETIVIVGSRTPRSNVDSPVPVDVVTADEIARSGRTETGRILSQLEPSFISTPQTIADGSDHVDPASLRGLGPDQVLILVNGKRRHRSALMHVNGTFGRGTVGTDLNAIGVSSIKRIEILRDGAAAQYGSDAIAGVINIVTKDETDVVDLVGETGITASRDGAQLKAGADYGFKIGQKGFLNISGDFLQKQATNRAGQYSGPIYDASGATDPTILSANNLSRDYFKMKIGEAAATSSMGGFNLEIPFEDNTATFYSFGDVSYRRGRAGGFYRFPQQQAQNVPEFYPNGFLPEIRPTLNDAAITVGLRRKGAWIVDASLTHGQSSFRFDIENSVNASLGTSSPTTFDAGTLSSSEDVANLDLQHKLVQALVDKSTLVLGSEIRIENYQIHAGDLASYTLGNPPATYGTPPLPKLPGAQVFPGFQPSNEVDRSRDNVGVYAGLENEVGGGLALDFGGRFESYSDFGQSTIGKIAAREKLSKYLSLRAGANTGFRAPSLQQLWFSNVSTLFLPDATGMLQPTQVLTSNNQSPVTKAFGIPKLHEEQSLSLSGGLALRPLDNLSITADGYFIRIDDRIVLTSQFASSNATVASILAPFPGVSQAQFFANAVDTNTTGADVVADYTVDAGEGQVALTAAANFSRTEVVDVHIPASLVAAFGSDPQLSTFFFGRGAKNRLEDLVPHQKGFAAIRYGSKTLSALFRADYYGRVLFKPDNPANDEVFGAKVLFDVDLGFHASKEITISIGADNLLNTFPDKQVKDANISFGRFIYSRNVSQFGENGGFYYAKLQLTL